MACPGCNYTSNCSSFPTVSYAPSPSSHNQSSVSYSHNSFSEASASLGSAAYTALAAYSSSGNNPGYAGLPSQINYQISSILKDIVLPKNETEPEQFSASPVRDLVPAQKNDLVETTDERQAMLAQQEIMEALHRQLLQNASNGNISNISNGNVPEGTIRLTQIEEETIILHKKRVRVMDIIPGDKMMKNVTPDDNSYD